MKLETFGGVNKSWNLYEFVKWCQLGSVYNNTLLYCSCFCLVLGDEAVCFTEVFLREWGVNALTSDFMMWFNCFLNEANNSFLLGQLVVCCSRQVLRS